jgi:hypothetical protein
MRIRRNEVNTYTENFNQVVQEATGIYAWLMGDDDAPLPGAVARMLGEVQQNPRDLYIIHALEATMEDRPLERRAWYRDLPRQDWALQDQTELKTFLDHTAYMAGAFGFISVLVVRREAWLEGLDHGRAFVSAGWPHVAMGLALARRHGRVRVLPDTLLLNRVGMDTGTGDYLFRRIMHDLRGWVRLADRFFSDDPELRRAFIGVLRRNTSQDTVLALRVKAPDAAAWEEARTLLLSAYHSPQNVAQAELAFAALQLGRRLPSPALDPARLCFADLGFVARGSRRTAVLVRDPAEPGAAAVINGLQAGSRAQLRVYGPGPSPWPEGTGPQWRSMDLDRFVRDLPGREPLLADLRAFAPDLVVNADPARHPALDLLAACAQAVAAVAHRAPGNALRPEVQAWLDTAYPWLLPDPSPQAMLQALGLGPEYRLDPAQVLVPIPPPPITRQAFLVDPDWSGDGWTEPVLSYLDAFRPGEPVLLILYLGQDRAGLTRAEATRKVVELALGTGRQAFPDVVVVDSLVELGEVLGEYPVHARLNPAPGNLEGLTGPFGQRLAQSRIKVAAGMGAGSRP